MKGGGAWLVIESSVCIAFHYNLLNTISNVMYNMKCKCDRMCMKHAYVSAYIHLIYKR